MPQNVSLGICFLWIIILAGCGPSVEQNVAREDLEEPSNAATDSTPADAIDWNPPAGPGAMAPEWGATEDGIFLTWLEPDDPENRERFTLRVSQYEDGLWSEPQNIHGGPGFFANWADLPALTRDADGGLVAHWLGMLGEDTYAYGVHLARSGDDGASWTAAGLLHDDATPTEHGFVSWVPSPDGLHAFWLDGRGMKDGGPMTLRTTRLGADGPEPSVLLDDRVCECCSTDAAWTSNGPVVVYRDRDGEEVRNIGVVRATPNGWSEPTVLHDDGWQIHGCPVNGPAIAADGDRVAVAWFTVHHGASRVQVAFSNDGGASFGEPVLLDGDGPLGRVDLALDSAGDAHVLWLARQEDSGEIRLRRVTAAGELGDTRVVTQTSQSRSAGVPRLLRHEDRFLVAWVEDAKPSRLRVASLGG